MSGVRNLKEEEGIQLGGYWGTEVWPRVEAVEGAPVLRPVCHRVARGGFGEAFRGH
jgi:hypothetical protein